MPLPLVQRAFIQPNAGSLANLKFIADHPVPKPSELGPDQCLVKVEYSGVCHSDLTIAKKGYARTPKTDLIGGHEGIGTIVAIGSGSETNAPVKTGDRVGVWFVGACCQTCEACSKGYEGVCAHLKPTGLAVDGTFCEYTVAYTNHVVPIPSNISSPEAAPIMCAGVTVYAALRTAGAGEGRDAGKWVVIPGAGGGLGHLAVQYARAMGFRVIAVDTGATKRALTQSLGAEHFIDYASPEHGGVIQDILSLTDGHGAHLALVCTDHGQAYKDAVMYLRTTGVLMVVGLPPGVMFDVPIVVVAGKGLTIKGLLAGSRQYAVEAVALAASGKVKSHYSLRGLSELAEVYAEMERGEVAGRVVLDISK